MAMECIVKVSKIIQHPHTYTLFACVLLRKGNGKPESEVGTSSIIRITLTFYQPLLLSRGSGVELPLC